MNDLQEYENAINNFLENQKGIYPAPNYFKNWDLPNIWDYFTEDYYDDNEDDVLTLQINIPEEAGYIYFVDRAGQGWYFKDTTELEEDEPEVYCEYVRSLRI